MYMRVEGSHGSHTDRNDDFFTEKPQASLAARPRTIHDYETRLSVHEWLDSVAATPQNWASCWAETVKKTLIIDKDDPLNPRPTSTKLLDMVEHVRYHVKRSQEPSVDCPNRNGTHILSVEQAERWREIPLPDITVDDHTGDTASMSPIPNPVIEAQPHRLLAELVPTPTPQQRIELQSYRPPIESFAVSVRDQEIRQVISGRQDSKIEVTLDDIEYRKRLYSMNSTTESDRDSNTPRRVQRLLSTTQIGIPENSYGILFNPTVRRTIGQQKKHDMSKDVKAVAISGLQDNAHAVFLSKHTVFVYELGSSVETPKRKQDIILEKSKKGWEHISLAGTYMACWGFCDKLGRKLVSVSCMGK